MSLLCKEFHLANKMLLPQEATPGSQRSDLMQCAIREGESEAAAKGTNVNGNLRTALGITA
jgi:hypothetical protein